MLKPLIQKTLLLLIGIALAGATWAATSQTRSPLAPPPVTLMDPHKVVGYSGCAKCHANEIEVWKGTPHFATFETLHRRPKAKEIAKKLGIASIKYDGRCTGCHYTQKTEGSDVVSISGVSCESCHGPASDWLNLHADYGGEGITRATESEAHREQRITESVAAGMRNPHNVYAMAQSCMRCHTVPDEELVNVGGHSFGSLDFEMVSWSQGMVRHRFLASSGTNNDMNTPERIRMLFVAGMNADLEFSLRATTNATEKADFAMTAAKRSSRAAKRLASVYKKTKVPELRTIIEIYMGVKLKLNNRESLIAAADQIATLGSEFATQYDGTELDAIEAYVPKKDRWVFEASRPE